MTVETLLSSDACMRHLPLSSDKAHRLETPCQKLGPWEISKRVTPEPQVTPLQTSLLR